MKGSRRHRVWCASLLVIAGLVACGDNLINDPSFDLWCGDKLCAPWQAKGTVKRVGTWHAHDYGVSLADHSVLSQLSTHAQVDCIEFEVIADVDATASVHIEMDFQDDGVSEYDELVPESHWARLRYLVNTPNYYDKVRFIVRKQGTGRAVIAQVKATSSTECDGPELELRHQPAGAYCDTAEQCVGMLCEVAPVHYVDATKLGGELTPESLDERHACSVCSDNAGCAADEVCDVVVSHEKDADGNDVEHAVRACLPVAKKALGAWCMNDAACTSGVCAQALALVHGTCGECTADADCKSGEVCGMSAFKDGPARSCHAPEKRVIGDACAANKECASGECCYGSCAECCDDTPCPGGKTCKAYQLFLTASPSLCALGKQTRAAGEACIADQDCRSGACAIDPAECLVPDTDCGLLRQVAGVCR